MNLADCRDKACLVSTMSVIRLYISGVCNNFSMSFNLPKSTTWSPDANIWFADGNPSDFFLSSTWPNIDVDSSVLIMVRTSSECRLVKSTSLSSIPAYRSGKRASMILYSSVMSKELLSPENRMLSANRDAASYSG